MPERRLILIGNGLDVSPALVNINIPDFKETELAIELAKALVEERSPVKGIRLSLEGHSFMCLIYEIRSGNEKKIYAVNDCFLVELNEKKDEVLRYVPFTFFVRR